MTPEMQRIEVLRRASRLLDAVVDTYEGRDYLVPPDLVEASVVQRARRFRQAQRQRGRDDDD